MTEQEVDDTGHEELSSEHECVFISVPKLVVAFSSLAKDFGRMFDHSFPAFLEVEISSRTLISLLCQDQSTVA